MTNLTPEEIRARAIVQQRRAILETMMLLYPNALGFPLICSTFIDTDRTYIMRDLAYLLDKNFVQLTNPKPNQAWDDKMFRLSSAGVEIAQRITSDPSLTP